MQESYIPPAIVVGIDGSRAAVNAALWAVDEAVSRDIPLRLVYAIESGEAAHVDPDKAARDLATAEIAVRQALIAVEATGKPVKIEVEILQGRPTHSLMASSGSAAMICVGSLGLKHATQDRVGSTAAALAASARCPVAIIRGNGERRAAPGWVVVEVDASTASSGILERGLEEARLRGAPLRVLRTWQSRFTDIHDARAVTDGNRLVKAQLDRRLSRWKHRYPDLDVKAVAVHGDTLNYLARNAKSIQLVVVGRQRVHGVSDFVGPSGHAALQNTDCSVLICEPQNAL
jgi:nucleotide-binding universal stress UspA family protein